MKYVRIEDIAFWFSDRLNICPRCIINGSITPEEYIAIFNLAIELAQELENQKVIHQENLALFIETLDGVIDEHSREGELSP